MKKYIVLFLIIFLPVFLLVLAFFSMPKFSLFSSVDGQVLSGGKAVAWLQITRKSHSRMYDGDTGGTSEKEGTPVYFTETTITDSAGKFHFPERVATGLKKWLVWLPHEPYIDQEITLMHEGKEQMLYVGTKRNYDTDGELQVWKFLDKNGAVQKLKTPTPDGDAGRDPSWILTPFPRPIHLICDLSDTTMRSYDTDDNELSLNPFRGICILK